MPRMKSSVGSVKTFCDRCNHSMSVVKELLPDTPPQHMSQSWKTLTDSLLTSIRPTDGYYCSICGFGTLASGGWVVHLRSSEHMLLSSLAEFEAATCPECGITVYGEPEKLMLSNEHMMLHEKLQKAKVMDSTITKKPLENEQVSPAIPPNAPTTELKIMVSACKPPACIKTKFIKLQNKLNLEENSVGYYCDLCDKSWLNDIFAWRQHVISMGHGAESMKILEPTSEVAAKCNFCGLVVISTGVKAKEYLLYHGNCSKGTPGNPSFVVMDIELYKKNLEEGKLVPPAPPSAPNQTLMLPTNNSRLQQLSADVPLFYYCYFCNYYSKDQDLPVHVETKGHKENQKTKQFVTTCKDCGFSIITEKSSVVRNIINDHMTGVHHLYNKRKIRASFYVNRVENFSPVESNRNDQINLHPPN